MKVLELIILSLSVQAIISSPICKICESTIKGTASTLSLLIPNFIAIEGLQALCMRKYDSEKLCKRVGQQIAPLAISNFLKNHINPDKRCSSVCNSSFVHYDAQKQAERILNGNQLKQISLARYIEKRQFTIPFKKMIKVLHLSDIHEDKNYVEKSSINCQYPICCHEENGFPQNPSAQAQPFGSKSCDSPKKLLISFLDYIQKVEEINVVLGTGDFSAHNQWQKTTESIIQTQNEIEQKIMKKFSNAIFIKAQGNNDYVPDHQYDASKSPKLIKVTSIKAGTETLTFVALNSIAYDDFNLYLLGDQSYAIFQLMLLQQILNQEKNVYILGHIPPTISGTAPEYATVYRALVAKYSDKIKGQFFGHTHSDQLTINTYPNTDRATGFGFICPSLSPLYIGTARSRVYQIIVGAQNGVNDYTQYIFKDLSSKTANWGKQYSFREKYSLSKTQSSLTIQEISGIKAKILQNKSEQIKYIRTTGLNQQYGSKSHCYMIDDWIVRKKCFARGDSLSDQLYKILDQLRGKWGYSRHLAI